MADFTYANGQKEQRMPTLYDQALEVPAMTADNQRGLVFACIAPHAWLLVPLTSGAPGTQAQATRAAMEEMGRQLAAAQPETIVLITPHGLRIEEMIPLLDSVSVRGGVSCEGLAPMGGSRHGFSLTFEVDRTLNAAIVEAAHTFGVPIARAHCSLDWMALELDFGSTNPLWFLGATVVPQPQLVVASVGSWLTRAQCVRFGQSIRQAIEALDRRVAFIASADMAHTFAADSHFGYDPAAAKCDETIIQAIHNQRLESLLDLDPALIAAAKTEAIEPLLVLYGVTERYHLQSEVLSYEVPTYFGMLCAAYTMCETGQGVIGAV